MWLSRLSSLHNLLLPPGAPSSKEHDNRVLITQKEDALSLKDVSVLFSCRAESGPLKIQGVHSWLGTEEGLWRRVPSRGT